MRLLRAVSLALAATVIIQSTGFAQSARPGWEEFGAWSRGHVEARADLLAHVEAYQRNAIEQQRGRWIEQRYVDAWGVAPFLGLPSAITPSNTYTQFIVPRAPAIQQGGGGGNPIAATRLPAADTDLPNGVWSTAGVYGGIPTDWVDCETAACDTLIGGTVTEASIESAVSSAPDNTVVRLPAGRYTGISSLRIGNDKVIVRGHASGTTLVVGGSLSEGCGWGIGQLMNVCTNGSSSVSSTNVTSGYSQGSTRLVVESKTGIVVDQVLWLDQVDDDTSAPIECFETSSAYPAAGDVCMSNWGSGEAYLRTDRGLAEGHRVTAVEAGTCAPSCDIDIFPPVYGPTYRSAQDPEVWFVAETTLIDMVGLEDFTVEASMNDGVQLSFSFARDVWAKGVNVINTDSDVTGGEVRQWLCRVCFGVEIRDGYMYGPMACAGCFISVYGLSPTIMSHSRIENMILHCGAIITDSASYGNVYAYNVFESLGCSRGGTGFTAHAAGMYDLLEGNQMSQFSMDNIHIGHFFYTFLRNHLDGNTRSIDPVENAPIFLYAAQRFMNALGNVMGANEWTTYEVECDSVGCSGSSQQHTDRYWHLGWVGTSGGEGETGNDSRVKATLMRWGNWDAASSSNDTGTCDSTGIKWDVAEVPDGLTSFANPDPSSQTVPSSYIYSSTPTWWPSGQVWPPIGPDVCNGNMTNTSTSPTGGRANKIPAKACFDAASNHSQYPSSSPRIKDITRAGCGYQ